VARPEFQKPADKEIGGAGRVLVNEITNGLRQFVAALQGGALQLQRAVQLVLARAALRSEARHPAVRAELVLRLLPAKRRQLLLRPVRQVVARHAISGRRVFGGDSDVRGERN
jgi:hypothetical protein